MKYKRPIFLSMLALALTCVTIRNSSAHEGEEEDISPIPVTLGATWQTTKFTAVAQGGQAIAETKDIKQGRKAFGDLSQALIKQLGKTPPARGKYYILHCPMAKVGNGDWIQATQ